MAAAEDLVLGLALHPGVSEAEDVRPCSGSQTSDVPPGTSVTLAEHTLERRGRLPWWHLWL